MNDWFKLFVRRFRTLFARCLTECEVRSKKWSFEEKLMVTVDELFCGRVHGEYYALSHKFISIFDDNHCPMGRPCLGIISTTKFTHLIGRFGWEMRSKATSPKPERKKGRFRRR